MAWGRIDDGHWRHRKVAALNDDMRKPCIALFWLAVSWANDHGTDGRVTRTGLRQLDGTTAEADELVRVGLWDKDDKGYAIHDFLDFNKSQEQLAAEKAQRTMAGTAGAAAKWSRGESHGKSLGTSLGKSSHEMPSEMHGEMDAPYPVSRTPVSPEPAPLAREGLPHIDDEAVRFLEGLTGRPVLTAGQKQLTEYDRQIETHGLANVITAYRKVAKTMRGTPQARQVIWSALRVLEPFVSSTDLKKLEAEDRQDEEERARQNRLEATRRRIKEMSA